MSLGSRKASRHETVAASKVAGVDASAYWVHKPGERVMTVDGILGTVTAVQDGPVPGNEAYEVSLDKGMGGGLYTASQLSPAGTTTASTTHTADQDYPELGTVLTDRPDIAVNTVLASKTALEMNTYEPGGDDDTVSKDCAPGGSGSCDGYDYETGRTCECPCHSSYTRLPATVEGVKDWHDDMHGVGKYAPENAPEDGSYPGRRASKTAANDAEMSQYSSEVANQRQNGPYKIDSHRPCDFCGMSSNAQGAGGEVVGLTHRGDAMHPSCAEEWEHGVGVDYDHDIDQYKADVEDDRRADRDDDYYSDPDPAMSSGDPYDRHADAMDRHRTYSADRPSFNPEDPGTWSTVPDDHQWASVGDGGKPQSEDDPSWAGEYHLFDGTGNNLSQRYYDRQKTSAWSDRDPGFGGSGPMYENTCEYCGGDHDSLDHEDEGHPDEPEADDSFIHSPAYGGYSAEHGGHSLGIFPNHGAAQHAIYSKEKETGYYPNLWHVNERGAADLDDGRERNEWEKDPHAWRMRNDEHYAEAHNAEQEHDLGHDVDDAMEGSEHLKGLLDDNKIGPTKYSSAEPRPFAREAAVPNVQRDPDDMSGHCAAGDHDSCEDYADTNCLCQCHDHHGVPAKYKTGWEDDQYYPEPFPRESSLHYDLVSLAAADSDFRFEFTASWSDVRAKAKRIRAEGGIRIISAGSAAVVAEVQGDHHIYETGLQYVPGARKIATWQCGCKWAAYAWGRSPQYKRFEGRMCSHALALQFEAQSRGMFGRDIKEDEHRLPGQHQRTPVVIQYDKGREKNDTRRTVPPGNMRSVWSKVVEPAPVITAVAAMATSGDDADEIGMLLTASHIPADGLVAFAKTAAVNDAWGEPVAPQNTWPMLPGATKPRDPNENPASSGWASSPDPVGWHSISPTTMGDRVAVRSTRPFEPGDYMVLTSGRRFEFTDERKWVEASLYSEEAEDGDTDVCANCGESIKRTTIDPNVPWVHHHSGNSKCDVSSPADAVMLQGVDSGEAMPTLHEASMNDEDTAIWDAGANNLEGEGAVATLHDEPEGALPATDGGLEANTDGLLGDQSDQMHAVYDDALSPESESIQSMGSVEQIVAEFQRTAGASKIMAGGGRSSAGPSDSDIAAAAREHLEKTALKNYSPAEQRALIHEQGKARNTDRLDIADTHYAALDAIRGDDETDEDWLG